MINTLLFCKWKHISILIISVIFSLLQSNEVYADQIKFILDRSNKVNNRGIYQVIWGNELEAIIVYYIYNARYIDHMPKALYKELDKERISPEDADNAFRMSVWKYDFRSSDFQSLKNYRYPEHKVFRFSSNGKILAVYNGTAQCLDIIEDEKTLFRFHWKKYLKGLFNKGKLKSNKPSPYSSIYGSRYPSAYPIMVSDDKVIFVTFYHDGNFYMYYLFEINFRSKSIKMWDVRYTFKRAVEGIGATICKKDIYLFSTDNICHIVDNEIVPLYSIQHFGYTIFDYQISDVVASENSLYVLLKSEYPHYKKLLYRLKLDNGNKKLLYDKVLGVHYISPYLVVIREQSGQKCNVIIENTKTGKIINKTVSGRDFFPIISPAKEKLALFPAKTRKKPIIIDIRNIKTSRDTRQK